MDELPKAEVPRWGVADGDPEGLLRWVQEVAPWPQSLYLLLGTLAVAWAAYSWLAWRAQAGPPATGPCIELGRLATGHRLQLAGAALFEAILVLGRPGSGKTSGIILPALAAVLGWDRSAAIVLDPKGDLAGPVAEIARRAGRSADVHVLAVGGRWRWNPMGHLSATSTVRDIRTVAADLVAAAGEQTGDRFWADTASTALAYVLQLCALTGAEVSLAVALELVTHLGDDPESRRHRAELAELAGREVRRLRRPDLEDELARTMAYLDRELASLAERTRSVVVAVLTNLLRRFDTPEYRGTFSGRAGEADQLPALEELVDEGRLLLVDLRRVEDATIATQVLSLLKAAWSRAILTRDRRGASRHPVATVLDEYQQYAAPSDADLFELGRSSRSVVIVASQQLTSIRAAIGGVDAAARVVGSLGTVITFSHRDPTVTRYLTDLVGEEAYEEVAVSEPAGWIAQLGQGRQLSRRTQRRAVVTAELIGSLGRHEAAGLVDGRWVRFRTVPWQ